MSENLPYNADAFKLEEESVSQMNNKRPKRLRLFQLIIIVTFLIFIAFLLFIYFYSELVVDRILSEDQIFQVDKLTELETAKERLAQEAHRPASPRLIRTFGDSFTSLSMINRDLTDMYWDSQVAAFLFPPRLTMQKIADCDETACGYFIHDANWQGFCRDNDCLERVNNDLFFNGEALSLPVEINQERLISLSIGGVGGDWYIGFIFGNEQDEEVWLYRFNGFNWQALINEDTELSFNLSSGQLNGHLSFGGQLDDLIIVYGGYYGKIMRLIDDEQLIDLSEFFSLRLTSGGFFPIIESSAKARSIYICNSRPSRPSLIKLWQADDGQVIGSVNLLPVAFPGLSIRRLVCLAGDHDHDLKVLINTGQTWQKWQLVDQGFSNKIIRQIVSRNFNLSNSPVRAAIVNSYLIKSEKSWADTFQLFFSASGQAYTPVLPGDWYQLDEPGDDLYWRIIFRTDDNPYYSPWFNNLSVINYEIVE